MKNILATSVLENHFTFLPFGELTLEEAVDLFQDRLCSERMFWAALQ
jgi:hypothetical protein